jgi:mannitol-specific phosphotransferase system IIBC component
MQNNNSDWKEWSKYVLKKIESFDKLDDKIDKITIELTVLKVKAGIIGFLSAIIASAIISFLISFLLKK